MTPDQFISYYGGNQTKAAESIGVDQSAVAHWLKNGDIPELRQYQIELATGGALLADKPACRTDNCSPKVGAGRTAKKK